MEKIRMPFSSSQLLWSLQSLVCLIYCYASFQYHVNWCKVNKFEFTQTEFIIFSGINMVIVLAFPLLNYFYLLDKLHAKKCLWLFILILPAEAYTSMVINALVDTYFLRKYHLNWLMSSEHINSRFFINFSFLGLFSIQKLLEDYFNRQEREKIQKINQLESEIKLLRSQIHPHFLFNSLNNIYSYAVQKKDETPDLILKLSDLLRFLSESKHSSDLIEARTEINAVTDLCDLYLVNKRWRDKVECVFQDERSGDFKIEPHSILTLVENAFKFTRLDDDDAYVKITLCINNKVCSCLIENTIAHEIHALTNGTGLSNLEKRLNITYKQKHKFNYSRQNNIFKAELILPLHDPSVLYN